MFATLMRSRRFAPLFWCQFLSAFNDNFLKNSLVFLILFKLPAEDSEALISLAGAVFIFPFFVCRRSAARSPTGSTRLSSRERLKLIEIVVAGIAVAGFWLHSIPIVVSRAVSVRRAFRRCSARSSTASCRIILRSPNFPAGNALIEGATFFRDPHRHDRRRTRRQGRRRSGDLRRHDDGVCDRLLGCGAIHSADRARRAGPQDQPEHHLPRHSGLLGALKADTRLWWGGMVVSWFWLVGAVMLSRAAVAGEERSRRQRGSRHRLSRDLLDRDRAWLRRSPPTLPPAASCSCRRWSPQCLLGLFALDLGIHHVRRHRGDCHARRRRRVRLAHGASMLRSTWPASPLPAACSSCRPSPLYRPGPERTAARASSRPSTFSTPRS